MTSAQHDTEVLIVGGGPVGLGLAIDLLQRGVDTIVVEQRAGLHSVPKGQNLTQRTGEHFQAWGISDRIRKASLIPHEFGSGGLTAYGSLTGGRFYDWFNRSSVRQFYAADNERLPQYRTEAVLRERLAELSGQLRKGWKALSLRQCPDGVELRAEGPKGRRRRIRALFVVGCDGSASAVRESAGIGQQVDDHAKRMALLVFKSRELEEIAGRFPKKSFFHIMRPQHEGYWQFLGRVDLKGTWFYHSPVAADEDYDSFDPQAHVNDAVGAEFSLSLKYLGFWDLRFAIADSYRRGRVFIAGDAAHSHPPYGGFGINLGFEDARNLSWKLQAELAGWAGPGLLDSYTSERRAVFASTSNDFILRMIQEDAEFLKTHDPARDAASFDAAWARRAEGGDADVAEFFPHYAGSPIIAECGGAGPGAKGVHRHDALPGTHLSPQRLDDGIMSHAKLGQGFTCIGVDVPKAAMRAFAREAAAEGIPMAAVTTAATEETKRWNASVILVRPDHFVAGAGKRAPDSIQKTLQRAVGLDIKCG